MTHKLYFVCSILCLYPFCVEKIAKISMYSFVSLLTPISMYLFYVFFNRCLQVFQLKALMCYSFSSLLDNYKYILLLIFNSDDVVMSRENWDFHLRHFVKGGALQ
jgi:drug/metabolite transporter (DMT)-like permease